METIQTTIIGKKAYSISEFCADHGISRAGFYNLIKSGKGPRLMKIGARRLISCESAAEWRRRMESAEVAA